MTAVTALALKPGPAWELVHVCVGCPVVRRFPVPSGWLYQVSVDLAYCVDDDGGAVFMLAGMRAHEPSLWHPPTFVPCPPPGAPDPALGVSGAPKRRGSRGVANTKRNRRWLSLVDLLSGEYGGDQERTEIVAWRMLKACEEAT